MKARWIAEGSSKVAPFSNRFAASQLYREYCKTVQYCGEYRVAMKLIVINCGGDYVKI